MRIRFMTDLIQEFFLFDPSAVNTPFSVCLHPEAIRIQFAARRHFQYRPAFCPTGWKERAYCLPQAKVLAAFNTETAIRSLRSVPQPDSELARVSARIWR
jgi:hypothetical protein